MPEFHASLSQAQVSRLVELVALDRHVSCRVAAVILARRWEERAMEARKLGLSTWRMWDELGMMALRGRARGDFL